MDQWFDTVQEDYQVFPISDVTVEEVSLGKPLKSLEGELLHGVAILWQSHLTVKAILNEALSNTGPSKESIFLLSNKYI